MFDVFYIGARPNLFVHEQEVESIAQAQQLSRTRYCWVINYLSDYTGWDWLWEPVPWQSQYIHAWPSQWQSDAGTYLVPKNSDCNIHYHSSPCIKRLSNTDHWIIPDNIDSDSFDFSWHPDPRDPDYHYHFPTQWQCAGGPEYPGSAGIKLQEEPRARALPQPDRWQVPPGIIHFYSSWHPNPLEPPYRHEFATQWYDRGGPVYDQPGATETKYHDQPQAMLGNCRDNWQILYDINEDAWDWSWRPHPCEDPYIYVWGNQHWPAEKMPTIEYHVPGATERKYMPGTAQLLANYENWITPDLVDPVSVDYSWCPDPGDPAYIYEFATQHQLTGGACYVVPGATERKYMPQQHQRIASMANWQVLAEIKDFDYSWHPDSRDADYTYVFGNQHYPAEIMPTVKYCQEGSTQEKFLDSPRASLAPTRANWHILEPIDEDVWDWTWCPDPGEPPYIYRWGNQWNPAELVASIEYRVPGASEIKYMSGATRRLPQPELFENQLAIAEFDYSWQPNPADPPMTYAFGSQWNPAVLEPAILYRRGGDEIKYQEQPIARLANDMTNWHIVDDIAEFDYSWRPNPTDPAYIYVFGNQWLTPEQRPAVEYHVAGASERKYMTEPRACRQARPLLFNTLFACEFDYSWEPDPGAPPYIYVFGNQWYSAEKMPTVEYVMPGATERKYMSEPRAQLSASEQCWQTVSDLPFEFDRSWCPDPGDPPLIYVFGNQWHAAEIMPTIEYHVSGASERKYMTEPRARMLPTRERWGTIPSEVDESAVDFSWCPDPGDPAFIYHFGSEYQISVGLTYTVPGATELKFAGDIPRINQETTAIVVPDIFYMDKSTLHSRERFERLQQRYPHIQRIRYVNSTQDTVRRCMSRSEQNRFWVISSENVYDNFDFAWHAEPWQSSMTHVFGSRWNKWSDTFLVNRWEFDRHSRWAENLEDFPNLNFVSDQEIVVPEDALPIYVIDHGNYSGPVLAEGVAIKHATRFYESYLETLRRLIADIEQEHVWVISTICDYSKFDFGWRPEPWQRNMLHVFASGSQKFGDTFYVPTRALQRTIESLDRLEYFESVNFVDTISVPRLELPVIVHKHDTHVDAVKKNQFVGPLAIFTCRHDEAAPQSSRDTVSLWTPDTRTVVCLDSASERIIVPREAAVYVKDQIYDYPYIDKSLKKSQAGRLQDIMFISYDELQADENWKQLSTQFPRAKRIHGVKGMEKALEAAAEASTTPWYFAVFAKTELEPTFDFTFVPDYLQQPKNYVFDCLNAVNGLQYGHMGIVMYNCRQLLQKPDYYKELGLDYTLSFPHEIVPILSCHGRFDSSPYQTWRTAFRECSKLSYFNSLTPAVDNEYRLRVWTTKATGPHAEWALRGADDGVKYFQFTNGDLSLLKNSFDWEWLRDYFCQRYGNLT